jgi:hypothetical protein
MFYLVLPLFIAVIGGIIAVVIGYIIKKIYKKIDKNWFEYLFFVGLFFATALMISSHLYIIYSGNTTNYLVNMYLYMIAYGFASGCGYNHYILIIG